MTLARAGSVKKEKGKHPKEEFRRKIVELSQGSKRDFREWLKCAPRVIKKSYHLLSKCGLRLYFKRLHHSDNYSRLIKKLRPKSIQSFSYT